MKFAGLLSHLATARYPVPGDMMARSLHIQITDHDDALPSYLVRLTQAPLLTHEQEVRLTRLLQRGDMVAKQQLIESNMRLVINIAKGYHCRAVPMEDLIQEGAIGLMLAADRFDPEKGFRFSTYATHWVRQAIGRAIDNKSKAIRLPAHVSQSLRRVEKERVRLSREMGSDPSPDQLATALGISSKKLLSLLQSSQDLLSLDMTFGDGNSVTLGGTLRHGNDDPEEKMHTEEMVYELRRILSELNEREQHVIGLRYSLDGISEPALQDEIAQDMKLSRERVRQIEVQAIKKLRNLAQRRKLKDYLTS